MNKYMMAFLLACTILGLWSPRRVRLGGWIVALAAVLVLFFFLSPNHL